MLTTEEEMAVEILKGNMTAATALAQKLCDDMAAGVRLPPINKITCDVSKLRVVVYFPSRIDGEHVEIDTAGTQEGLDNWLNGSADNPLILQGAERIELYELP